MMVAKKRGVDKDAGEKESSVVSATCQYESGKKRFRMLGVVAVVLAVACAALAVLLASSHVPSNAAAKVNDSYITEEEVAAYINQYRINNAVTDDADFAQALLAQNLNVASFRQNCINQMALSMLIDRRAAELGCTPSQEEVDAQYNQMKEGLSFGSDEAWQETLDDKGMDEQGLRAHLATNLAEQALYKHEVSERQASADETLSYIKSYLAGQTLKHSYHIVFSGEEGWQRAQECCAKLKEIGSGLDAKTFSKIAKKYSEDEGVAENGGSYVWADETTVPETYQDALAQLKEGEYSDPTTIDLDEGSNTQILFCDVAYTFPAVGHIDSLKLTDLPSSVQDHAQELAGKYLWSVDCENYLAGLLHDAKITYYPMPSGAAYDVDLALAAQAQKQEQTDE